MAARPELVSCCRRLRSAQLGRRLAAEVAIFLERLADDAVELCRQFGIQIQGRRGRLVKNGIEDHSNTGAGKSLATGRHLIQDRPETKEVGAGTDVLAERAEQLASTSVVSF